MPTNMKVSPKKMVQVATAILLVTCYTTFVVLLQQGSAVTSQETFQDGENTRGASARSGKIKLEAPVAAGFQERAPRSIGEIKDQDYPMDNSIGNAGGDPSSYPTSLTVLGGSANRNNNHHNNKSDAKNTDLTDIFISVKTTSSFHQSRLDVILRTWFVLAREHTYFFSDSDDPVLQLKTNGHLINTNCSSSHNRKALCCKMSVEFDTFLDSNKKWFCHFDDDNYVNVPRLVRLLQRYNPREDWYLGKPSIRAPLEIFSRDNPKQKIAFWFATGGAGFCISRALALKMVPLASGGKFISIGEKIRLPDDVTMGYVIEHLLKKRLTVVEEFHSHLEPMKFLKADSYADQVTFSYSRFGREMNALAIDGFDPRLDPTRFLSLHCHLFPNFSFCLR